MTSIFQNAGEIVTEITMTRQKNPWLIVEGESDEKLFRSRKFRSPVKIAVANGWEGVQQVLAETQSTQATLTVVGVIDRDYRDHDNKQPTAPNIVLSDMRDIDVMMFYSPALERVYGEIGSASKLPKDKSGLTIDFSTIRNKIVDICEQIGKYRSFSYVNSRKISFKELDFDKFICRKSLLFNANDFLNHLRGKNSGIQGIDQKEWVRAQNGAHLNQTYRNPEFICNGHDLMSVACISLHSLWGSIGSKVNREELERLFRIGYSDSDLEKSQLWLSLKSLI